MKVYTLKVTQRLPISLEEAWSFFSTPDNLKAITPEHMKFDIQYKSGGDTMYPGQIIRYRLQPFPGVPLNWTTEITQVEAPNYFVDEQRFGPYALWHHQHHFRAEGHHTEMTDEVNYALPLSIIGRFSHWLFVERQVKSIFDYRFKVLEQRFGKAT